MPDRTVTYSFKGNFANLSAGLKTAQRNVDQFGNKLLAADRNGAKMRAGLTTLGNSAGKVGLVAAAGIGVAVAAAANFEQAMSDVQAATHETAGNMELLRQAAIEAGQATKFSATEAAAAIENLAKAGVSTTDILGGGLKGALNLAAAGNLDVADAAEIAATAMTQFQLSGKDVPHIADLLAAGAGKAQGEVADMAEAMKYAGVPAANLGVTIEETAGTIALFAKNGIIGEQAGTSMRGMLASLTSPSLVAKKQMDALGISVFDASGKFVGFDGIAAQLHDRLGTLTDAERANALGKIFGNEQLQAANVLYREGASAVDEWTKKVDDQGYAAETAAIKMDNLKGDLEQLRGSLETALIGSGSGSQGPLRSITQGATQAVNALAAVPAPAQNAALALGALTAVTGGGIWFGAKVVNGIAATTEALGALGIQADTTKAKLATLGSAGAAAALGFGTLLDTMSQMDSWQRSNEAADATVKSTQDLADALSYSNVGKYANDLHINLGRLTEDLASNGAQGEYASRILDQLGESSHGFGALLKAEGGNILPFYTDSATKASDANKDLKAIIDQMPDSLGKASGATTDGAAANGAFSQSSQEAAQEARDAASSVAELTKAMQEQVKGALSAFDAETQWRQSLIDAKKQADSNSAGIRGNSKDVLANRTALSGLADAWNNQSAAVKNNIGRFRDARGAFIETATAMGVPKEAARRLANQLLEIPESRVTRVTAETGGAMQSLNVLYARLAELNGTHATTYIDVVTRSFGSKAKSIPLPGQSADGSTVPKDGGAYGDRYPYLLAPGEEVISNRHGQADRHRSLLKAINAGRLADGGTVGRLADGGTAGNNGIDHAVKRLTAALARATNALDDETKARDKLRSQRDDIRSSVRTGLRSDIFAVGGNPWVAGAGSPIAGLRADNAQITGFIADVKKIRGMGVKGSALAEALGNPEYADLLAHMSASDLRDYQRLFNRRETLLRSAAITGSQAVGLDARESAAAKEVRGLRGDVRQLQHQLHAAELRAHKSRKEAAKDTADGVNHASRSGHRRGKRSG